MSSGGPAVINPRSEQTRLTPDAHRQVLTDIDERDARNSKSGSAAAEAVRLRKVRPMMFCPVDARTAILLTAAAADRSWRRRRRSGWRWRSGGGRRRRMPGRLSWPRRARVRVRMSGRTLLSAGCGRCSGGPKRWCVVGLGAIESLAHFAATFPDYLPGIGVELHTALKEKRSAVFDATGGWPDGAWPGEQNRAGRGREAAGEWSQLTRQHGLLSNTMALITSDCA